MAIREGIENQTNTEDLPLSTDNNPRIGVGTSQFVMMEQPNLTLEQTKDDLFGAVKSGNTVKVGELTGREPDVTRPDPSGTTRIEGEADHNRNHQDLEAQERKRLEQLQSSGIGMSEPDGIATAENPLGLQVGPHHHRRHSGPAIDIVEAMEEGDYTTIAQIHLATARRELNEHIDVNGDGTITGGERLPMSSMFTEDKFGMFHANDDEFIYDKFGGRYDAYGYRSSNGSYTNTSGEHYDAKTHEFAGKDGKPMEVLGAMKDMAKDNPDAGADYLQALDAQRNPPDGKTTPSANVDGQKGSSQQGAGLKTTDSPPATEKQMQHATVDVHAKGMVAKAGIQTMAAYKYDTLPAVQRMNWKLEHMPAAERKRILASKPNLEKFSAQYKHDILKEAKEANDATGKTTAPKEYANDEFRVVSADEVAKTLHSQPIVHHHAQADASPASSSTSTAAAGTPTSSADKVETATSTTWIADKDGGFWDEYGGYYDKTGAYWDADGTYYSPDGKFTQDPNGATSWADGSFTDSHGHNVDKDGNYVAFDGTRVKPPEGVDFKKQMMEADKKGERWIPPEHATAIEPIPSRLLEEMPFSFNLKPLELAPVTAAITNPALTATTATTATLATKDTTVPTSNIASKTTTIATDAKADASLKIDTSHFVQANVAPPASGFASAFGDFHDWLLGLGAPSTADTKSTSPSLSTSLMSSTAVTPPATTNNKTVASAPKPGM